MATRNSKRRAPLPTVFRTTSPLLTSGVPAIPENTPFENETRVPSLDWKKQALASATSSPNLKLLLRDRPVFKCPSCGLANQFVPTCLICRTSDAEAAEAFFKSIPTRVRRISAPGKPAVSFKPHVHPRDREAAETEPRISTDSGTSTLPPVTPKDSDAFPTELPPTFPMEQPKLAQFRPKKQVQPPRSTPPVSAPPTLPSLRHRGRIGRTAAGVVCLSPTVANPLPPRKPQSSTLGTQGKKRSVHFRPSLPPPPPTPIDPVHAIILAANPAISARELRSKEFERKRLDDPLYGAPPDWERRRASLGGRMSADGLRSRDSMPSIRWSLDALPATVGRSSARPETDMGSPKSTASRRLSHTSRSVVMAARADLAQRVSTPTPTHSRGKSLPEVGSGRFSSTLSRSSQSTLTTPTSRSPRPSISQSIPFASYALPRPSTSSLSNPRSSTSSKPRTSISSLASNWIPSKPRLSTHSARDWGILYEEVPAPPPSPRLGVGLKRSLSTFFGKVRTKLAS